MMAGRGLGHTGGTIDKLESIPNLRCDWSVGDFQRLCRQVGCVIGAATPELCPADHKLYALRDVTDTVSSLPLQTASIMSKKIAEHPDSLVLGTSVHTRARVCVRANVPRHSFGQPPTNSTSRCLFNPIVLFHNVLQMSNTDWVPFSRPSNKPKPWPYPWWIRGKFTVCIR